MLTVKSSSSGCKSTVNF
jgi:hypothetical protein